MSATIWWRTTSPAPRWTNARPSMPVQRTFETEQAGATVGDVDLGGVAGDDHLRPEPDAGEEHLHLLGRRVLRLVEDDEAVVERAAAHERERCDLDGLTLEQLLGALGLDHVVQRVVQRPQVRVDLGHQVAGQEAEALAGLDRRAGEDDPLHLLGLQRLDGHRDGEPALAGAGRADPERDHVAADRVDVPLLAGGLRPDGATLRAAHDVVGEHLARPLVVRTMSMARPRTVSSRCWPRWSSITSSSNEAADPFGVVALEVHLVAAHDDGRPREGTLDLAQELVARAAQGRHQVGAGDDHGVGGGGGRHAGGAATMAAEGLMSVPG